MSNIDLLFALVNRPRAVVISLANEPSVARGWRTELRLTTRSEHGNKRVIEYITFIRQAYVLQFVLEPWLNLCKATLNT